MYSRNIKAFGLKLERSNVFTCLKTVATVVTTSQLEISAVAQCYLSYFCQVNDKFSLLIYVLTYMARIVICYSIPLFIFDQCSISHMHMLENSQPQMCTAIILASHMYAMSHAFHSSLFFLVISKTVKFIHDLFHFLLTYFS